MSGEREEESGRGRVFSFSLDSYERHTHLILLGLTCSPAILPGNMLSSTAT